ncbi:FadR/GntR family transcriptional regulator [Nocardioides aequoreus]|uniref:FadR/GntR family transcriptional regulator n=1 Tax=Nocardioides aequoreus TaxID=397278 RepID=UPI0006901534|nr:FCD domain-containing protein [Nocardioides aequoreus]
MRLLTGDARQAVFAPLDDGAGRSAAVVRRLGSAIALGIIEDGEQLPAEQQLAASLNVATVTLREALADLRSRGLVSTRRGRGGGSFVRADDDALAELARGRLAELSTADLRELGDLRVAVGGTSARLAAVRASASELAALRGLVDRVAAARDGSEQRRLEGRYHIALAASTQSVRLTTQEIELQSELGQVLWGSSRSPAEVATDTAAHHAVLDAVEARDAALARDLAEEHLDRVTVRLIEIHIAAVRRGDGPSARGQDR